MSILHLQWSTAMQNSSVWPSSSCKCDTTTCAQLRFWTVEVISTPAIKMSTSQSRSLDVWTTFSYQSFLNQSTLSLIYQRIIVQYISMIESQLFSLHGIRKYHYPGSKLAKTKHLIQLKFSVISNSSNTSQCHSLDTSEIPRLLQPLVRLSTRTTHNCSQKLPGAMCERAKPHLPLLVAHLEYEKTLTLWSIRSIQLVDKHV